MAEYIPQARNITNISFATPTTMVLALMNTASSFSRTTKLECEVDQICHPPLRLKMHTAPQRKLPL